MKDNRTIWIALVVVLLALCFCCTLTVGFSIVHGVHWSESWLLGSRMEATGQFTQAVEIQGPISLGLDVPVGNITVKAGDSGQVLVNATKRAWGYNRSQAQENLDRIQISVEQAGNQVQVKATGLTVAHNTPRSPKLDLVIAVPTETTLTLNSNVGCIFVTGTHGNVKIKADVGEVILNDVSPVERLNVKTRVASIELNSVLMPDVAYSLESDVGRIALRVPEDSTFSIDARSDIGDVNLGFELSGRRSRENFLGKEVRGDVGSNPTTSLYLRSRVGDISVRPTR